MLSFRSFPATHPMVDASLVCSDGRIMSVHDGLLLGRVVGSDFVIDDVKCSRRHARLCVQGSVVEIEDLGSSNGTLLNGKQVQRRVLRDGDKIQIGKTVIVFREGLHAAQAASVEPTGDDNDLFGGPSVPTPKVPTKPVAATVSSEPAPWVSLPPLSPTPPLPSSPWLSLPPLSPPSPPSPPSLPPLSPTPTPLPPSPLLPLPRSHERQVVEFADEVVQVRPIEKGKSGAANLAPAAFGEPKIEAKNRVLQFQKPNASRGPLGDDLGQFSTGTKLLLFGAVLLGAALLIWLIIWLVR